MRTAQEQRGEAEGLTMKQSPEIHRLTSEVLTLKDLNQEASAKMAALQAAVSRSQEVEDASPAAGGAGRRRL